MMSETKKISKNLRKNLIAWKMRVDPNVIAQNAPYSGAAALEAGKLVAQTLRKPQQ